MIITNNERKLVVTAILFSKLVSFCCLSGFEILKDCNRIAVSLTDATSARIDCLITSILGTKIFEEL